MKNLTTNIPEKEQRLYDISNEDIENRIQKKTLLNRETSTFKHKVFDGYNFWTVKNVYRYFDELIRVRSKWAYCQIKGFWYMQTTIRWRKIKKYFNGG